MISDMLTFSFTLWMFRDVPMRRERTRWDTTLREYDLMGRVMNRISTGYTTKFTHGSLTTSTRSGAASFGSTRRTPTATSRRPSRRCFRSVIPLCSHAAAIFRLRNHSRAERGDRALHGSEGAGGLGARGRRLVRFRRVTSRRIFMTWWTLSCISVSRSSWR